MSRLLLVHLRCGRHGCRWLVDVVEVAEELTNDRCIERRVCAAVLREKLLDDGLHGRRLLRFRW